MAHDVFISYSTKDAAVADAVCAGLEARGIRCWIAPRNIVSGTKYSQSIINAITQSPLMVVIYSSHANESNHVVAEIDRAYNKRIPIIPFRIENVPLSADLEYYLSTSQWLDALKGPPQEHLERLIETVRLLLKKTGSLPKPAPSPRSIPPSGQITRASKSSRTPWLIAGLLAAFSFLVVAVLVIGIIVVVTRNRNSNESLANSNPASSPSPSANPNIRETINRRMDTVEAELMRRARKAILDAQISGDKKTLDSLLRQDFKTRRPDNQILDKQQLMSEVDSGNLIEGLRVPDRRKVTVTVENARGAGNYILSSVVKISYLDGGQLYTQVRHDFTVFVKENDRFVATINRWTTDGPPSR
ncbi:MAG: TIR domain-containing protein [Acidobacteriota bacterium]